MIRIDKADLINMNPSVRAQIEKVLRLQELETYTEPLNAKDIPAPVADSETVSSQKAVDLPSFIPFPNFREFGSYGGSTRGGDVSSRTLAMETKKCTIEVEEYSPSLEEAVKLDQFFDMYGYATNAVKVPNEDSRESWNYVKTDNVIINGSMPVQDMAVIKAMYNRGVRFWHTTDVGNYSLSNRDMKEVVTDDVG